MGNCSLKTVADGKNLGSVRVLTDSGKVFEFRCPKLAGDILREYPGYGIYGRNYGSPPLSWEETLVGGNVYYLLPQGTNPTAVSNNPNLGPKLQVSPLRKNGIWKVKMSIDTKQLEEIFAEEENTEALIERLRIAAATNSAATPSAKTAATSQSSGLRIVCGKHTIPKEGCI